MCVFVCVCMCVFVCVCNILPFKDKLYLKYLFFDVVKV